VTATARDAGGTDPLAAVALAQHDLAAAQEDLRGAVARARRAGASWADLGRVLGVTRQAAFKRFGSPTDPRDGRPMRGRAPSEVAALTIRAVTLLADGDAAALRALMTPGVAKELTEGVLRETWARAVAETGPLVAVDQPQIRHPDGTPEAEVDGAEVTGVLVGVTRIRCEAGEWEARVASDTDGRLVGLLVVVPGSLGHPF